MSLGQRLLLLVWAGIAVMLLISGGVELWLLLEGAVRKPHNSRLHIFFAFAVGAAIAASIIGARKKRTDAFQAMQAFGILTVIFGMLPSLIFAMELATTLTAEVRDWDIRQSLLNLALGLGLCGLGVATLRAFCLPPTKPNR
ncbi:MAG: hypothetical protein CFK49_09450 [Armatimonadetes bacterium JP3_11]|nr:MAG: hypothetical protein CFK49_09450 [Armatimonadetes bacterium JP3_11]RMH10780.1 MAG: hypothetical protein D6697_00225 [Armatimonadota bacterium]